MHQRVMSLNSLSPQSPVLPLVEPDANDVEQQKKNVPKKKKVEKKKR
jgi:hypothetical protein